MPKLNMECVCSQRQHRGEIFSLLLRHIKEHENFGLHGTEAESSGLVFVYEVLCCIFWNFFVLDCDYEM